MSISLEKAVALAAKLAESEATNARLRARIDVLSQAANVIRLYDWTKGGTVDDRHDAETSIECANAVESFISRVNTKVAT